MRFVVCVKYVPVLSELRFDPETPPPGARRRPRRAVSSFDVRALLGALRLRAAHGGEVVAVTMGPPAAREGADHCLALGADRGVHLCDPGARGIGHAGDGARAGGASCGASTADVVLLGRASVDAETGQVGPEVAELLDLPQATAVRALTLDPTARTFDAERETDEGFEHVAGPLPAVITAAEDIARGALPVQGRAAGGGGEAHRDARAGRRRPRAGRRRSGRLADLGRRPRGGADRTRRGELLDGTDPAALATRAARAAARSSGRSARTPATIRRCRPPPAATDRRSGSSAEIGRTGRARITRRAARQGGARSPGRSAARVEAHRDRRRRGARRRARRRRRRSRPGRRRVGSRSVHDRGARGVLWPTPSGNVRRGSCSSARRRAAATWRRASPPASASASPATRWTSTSTRRGACGS